MGNFDEHLSAGKKYGVAVFAVAALITYRLGFSTANIAITACIASALGVGASVLPDADHQDSKPRQKLGKFTSLGVISGTLYIGVQQPGFVESIGGVVAALGISGDTGSIGFSALLIAGVASLSYGGDLFDSYLTHRGYTHSVAFAVMTAVGIYALGTAILNLGILSGVSGVIISTATGGGILVHMYVDGMLFN